MVAVASGGAGGGEGIAVQQMDGSVSLVGLGGRLMTRAPSQLGCHDDFVLPGPICYMGANDGGSLLAARSHQAVDYYKQAALLGVDTHGAGAAGDGESPNHEFPQLILELRHPRRLSVFLRHPRCLGFAFLRVAAHRWTPSACSGASPRCMRTYTVSVTLSCDRVK